MGEGGCGGVVVVRVVGWFWGGWGDDGGAHWEVLRWGGDGGHSWRAIESGEMNGDVVWIDR